MGVGRDDGHIGSFGGLDCDSYIVVGRESL
jgi:hypothetical protein